MRKWLSKTQNLKKENHQPQMPELQFLKTLKISKIEYILAFSLIYNSFVSPFFRKWRLMTSLSR